MFNLFGIILVPRKMQKDKNIIYRILYFRTGRPYDERFFFRTILHCFGRDYYNNSINCQLIGRLI